MEPALNLLPITSIPGHEFPVSFLMVRAIFVPLFVSLSGSLYLTRL